MATDDGSWDVEMNVQLPCPAEALLPAGTEHPVLAACPHCVPLRLPSGRPCHSRFTTSNTLLVAAPQAGRWALDSGGAVMEATRHQCPPKGLRLEQRLPLRLGYPT